jgi:hypothetical protein
MIPSVVRSYSAYLRARTPPDALKFMIVAG